MQFAADDNWPELKDIGQALPRDALINKALALRPDLLGDKQRADQAVKDLALARKLNIPDVTFNAGFARDPSNTVLNSAFLGISVPVPLFYQYQGETSKAAANLNQMRLQAEETELVVRNDVVNALASWKSSNNVIKIYESKLLAQSTAIRDRVELGYSKGAVTVLDFIDAERNYKSVMLDYYTNMINRINAYYDLSKSLAVEPDAELDQHTEAATAIDSSRLREIE